MTGIICVDKPEGITSFRAVSKVRGITGEKKAGHCGTLDPMATGVLPVMLGGATRFLEFLPVTPKRYIARLRLGLRTDTLDRTGTVLSTSEVTATEQEVREALDRFRGTILQVPPMYSAVKKDGVRMYELARSGKETEREPRSVTIYELELVNDANPEENPGQAPQSGTPHSYTLKMTCSGGTYVRSLIDDLGTALGCGAVMTALRREAVGRFQIESAVTPEQLEQAKENGTLGRYIIPLETVLDEYPSVPVTEAQARRFSNGGGLALDRIHLTKELPDSALVRVLAPDGSFLGLGQRNDTDGQLDAKRIYVSR